MPLKIKIIGLEDFGEKAKEAARSLIETPVPLGKTVLVTTATIALAELIVFRKMRFTLILTRKYS